jgi:ATPase family protein associated with various cellular activities (AAA)
MSTLPNIPTANFKTAEDMLRVACLANKTILFIGDPGVGKTSIVRAVGRELSMRVVELLGSTLDPTDVGGLPVKHVDDRSRAIVERVPLRCIRDACDEPVILFLDELASAPAAVQAAFLRLILDHVAGDSELHPDTIVVAATNPPEQTPGGFDLTAPIVGRVAIVKFRPDEDEVIEYLRKLGDAESDDPKLSALAEEASIFAAIADQTPELLQIDIPKHCVNGGTPWASPRQCESMLRMRAAGAVIGMDPMSSAIFNLMAGSIGIQAATVYNGVMRMITELPSVDDIIADPEKATLPEQPARQIAALGLMPRIGKKNLYAAYIYAARMKREYGLAAHKALLPLSAFQPPPTDPLTKKGIQARSALSAMIGGPRKTP